jgi:hypothetical protein
MPDGRPGVIRMEASIGCGDTLCIGVAVKAEGISANYLRTLGDDGDNPGCIPGTFDDWLLDGPVVAIWLIKTRDTVKRRSFTG